MAHWLTTYSSGEWVTGQSGEKVFYAKDKLDFTYAKKVTLDSAATDVLYLLDNAVPKSPQR